MPHKKHLSPGAVYRDWFGIGDRQGLFNQQEPYDVICMKMPWGPIKSFRVPAGDPNNPTYSWLPPIFFPPGSRMGVDVGTDDRTAVTVVDRKIDQTLLVADLPSGTRVTEDMIESLRRLASARVESLTEEFFNRAFRHGIGAFRMGEDGSVEDVSERFLSGGGDDVR